MVSQVQVREHCATIVAMSLTRLQCAFQKGEKWGVDSSSCVFFNPQSRPGCLAFGGSTAARESIGGQVAARLALEHFVEGMLDFFHPAPLRIEERDTETVSAENLQAIEVAFKRANNSVFTFGHKLAAGGRMAASLIGVILQENVISIGKVGGACAYLARGGELYPFFDAGVPEEGATEGGGGVYVGSASLVSVQLSSVRLEEGDALFFFSDSLADAPVNRLFGALDGREQNPSMECSSVLMQLFPHPNEYGFAAMAEAGADVIFLQEECV